MYNPKILPLAKKDIQEAAIWYNQRRKGLGKTFTKEVREKVKFICQNPHASNIRYGLVRTTILSVFPYMIHYSVDDENKTVIISAILHTSRNPKIWGKR